MPPLNATESTWRTVATTFVPIAVLFLLIAAIAVPGLPQSNPELQKFFEHDIGLNQDQIASIRNGQPVSKNLPSRTRAEVFLFGCRCD